MQLKSLLFFLPLILGFTSGIYFQPDSLDELARLIGKGDSEGLSNHFSSTVELNMFGAEGVHSKAQAQLIMRDFFNKNRSASARVQHKLNSNPAQHFGVISMVSSGKRFRISVSLTANGQRYLIKEMRIELDRQ